MQTAHCCVMMVLHNHYAVHVHVLCDYALLCNVQLSIRFMGSGITDAAVLMSYAVDVACFAAGHTLRIGWVMAAFRPFRLIGLSAQVQTMVGIHLDVLD